MTNPSTLSGRVGPRVIVALDYPDAASAMTFVDRVTPGRCRLKVGKELFVAAGPAFVAELTALGFEVFLDLKFHDIPNTVAAACKAAARLSVWMMNVHASGGPKMLLAAREALESFGEDRPRIIAVTNLTSMGVDELRAIGINRSPHEQAELLADLAYEYGMDGVVCPAPHALSLRKMFGSGFLLVTPGIRPVGGAAGDQVHISTPRGAVDAGASYLVIGRPITSATDPVDALDAITQEIDATPASD